MSALLNVRTSTNQHQTTKHLSPTTALSDRGKPRNVNTQERTHDCGQRSET